MKKPLLTILPLILFSQIISAKGPKLQNFGSLMGKRIYENPLSDWLEKNDFKNATHEFQTDGPVLFVKHYQKGYMMTLDINMTLSSMSLYAKGGRYETYTDRLPFELRFGMNRDSLYRIIDLRLEETEDNPFILIRKLDNHILELLFNSKGLNQVNILLSDSLPLANDKSFVRLVSNGAIISGDCDSLKGKMTWNDGQATYEGEWENNMPHGKGYFTDQNNNWYKGEFRYGYFWGQGQLKVNDMYLYEGEFVMSRRHGMGKCSFIIPADESYEGQWRADIMEGLGKYTQGKHFYYYGNLSNNQFNGNGKIVTADGWMEGSFQDGLPHGFVRQFIKKENLLSEGSWVNGKREGKFKLTDEFKKVTYQTFVNDIEVIDK